MFPETSAKSDAAKKMQITADPGGESPAGDCSQSQPDQPEKSAIRGFPGSGADFSEAFLRCRHAGGSAEDPRQIQTGKYHALKQLSQNNQPAGLHGKTVCQPRSVTGIHGESARSQSVAGVCGD